jgi:hypothetical protein
LGAVGAVVVVVGAWCLLGPVQAQRQPRPVAAGGAAQAPIPSPLLGVAPTTTTSASPPWAGIGEDAPTKAGYWAQLSDPARSDLGPAVAAETSRLGATLVRADVTGEGRDAFYGYWGAGRAQPCCAGVVVHAAGASSTAHPDTVQVAVIWSATRLDGGPAVVEQTTVVYFARRGTHWVAVHSWELS